jgi:Lon protease-like protein
MPVRLPLFPLTVVLYPSTTLPLHIFEPRYRQLVADCLANDTSFGILRPGLDREAPPLGTVGCAAAIRAHDLLPDGRSNVLVEGGKRFAVERYVEGSDPYLVATVEEFDDRAIENPPPDTTELEHLFEAYINAICVLQDAELPEVALSHEPGVLTFQIAASIDPDSSLQVRLLESRSVWERMELLTQWLLPHTADVKERARVHHLARGNGHSTRPYPPARSGR